MNDEIENAKHDFLERINKMEVAQEDDIKEMEEEKKRIHEMYLDAAKE